MNKPKSVRTALAIMLFGLALATVSSILNTYNAPEHLSKPVIVTVTIIMLSINALLIYVVSLGKNWARLIYSAFLAINFLTGIRGPNMDFVNHWFTVVNYWIGMGLCIVILVLLFLPASNLWFKRLPNHA